jgi:hypothetical protein
MDLRTRMDEIRENARRLRLVAQRRMNVVVFIVYLVSVALVMLKVEAFHSIWFILFVNYAVLWPPNPNNDVVACLDRLEHNCISFVTVHDADRCATKLEILEESYASCTRSVWLVGVSS